MYQRHEFYSNKCKFVHFTSTKNKLLRRAMENVPEVKLGLASACIWRPLCLSKATMIPSPAGVALLRT